MSPTLMMLLLMLRGFLSFMGDGACRCHHILPIPCLYCATPSPPLIASHLAATSLAFCPLAHHCFHPQSPPLPLLLLLTQSCYTCRCVRDLSLLSTYYPSGEVRSLSKIS